ncbi:MAG TPA: MFS transporter [Patescibacteria group bacterium]|nr:MFS transporter [Patescibacteria group bacterium]
MNTPKIRFDLFAILATNFSDAVGFSLVIPFLVVLVNRFGGNAFLYGIVGATYSIFQLIGSPILGKWSDKFGRKPILIISQIGSLVGWAVFLIGLFLPITPLTTIAGFVFTLPLFVIIIARIIDGITGGNTSVAQAYIADISSTERRSALYGLFSVSQNIGFIVGPALAGILVATPLQEKLPVALAIAITIIAILFTVFFLPESHKRVVKTNEDIRFISVLKHPDIAFMLLLYFLIYLGFSVFYTAFPEYAITTLKWSVGKMGIYFSILSLLLVIVQGPVLSFLSKGCKDSVLAVAGTFLLAINFLLLTSRNDILIYLALIFFATGNGIMWPSILSIVSKVAGKTYQGTVQGLSSSMGSLASIVGLIAGGILFDHLGGKAFLVSAGVIFFVLLLSLRLFLLDKEVSDNRE